MERGVRSAVDADAGMHGGVVSRRRLAELGVDRDAAAREVAAGRWAAHGRHTLAVHCGPLPPEALWWRAVWETGRRVALLDGVSSLMAAGLTGFAEPVVHVSVTRNSRCPRPSGVRVHRVTRLDGERAGKGSLPRTRPEIAALRAAHWAVSDRQAALVIAMAVQQRLVRGQSLVGAVATVRGRGRQGWVRQVVTDVAGGAQSLGELDFAVLCRRHGIPEPERQVVRTGARGRMYLDVRWSGSRLAVEIDGAGHRTGLAVSSDNLRQNEVTLGDDRVLRIDVLGMRLHEAEFFAQIRRGLR